MLVLPAAAACLVAATWPASALEPPAEDRCARETWVLAGAASQPDEGRATFVPEWTPVLEVVAACLRTDALAGACLVVRGLTDELDFSPALARAFGSVEAVQLARGQGRAVTVQARLEALGVAPQRLRTAAAVLGGKVRGVELRLVRGCVGGTGREGMEQSEVEALVDRRVGEALAALEPRAEPPGSMPATLPEVEAPAIPVAEPSRQFRPWLDAALDVTLLGLKPDFVAAPVLSVGAGVEWRGFVGGVGAGLAVGSSRAERIGFEASALAGRRLASGLELGGEARYRLASLRASGPWLEQVLGVGVRATLCPDRLAGPARLVCLSAAVHPFGLRWRRGEVRGGEPVRVPHATDYAAMFGVGVTVRWPGAPDR